MNVRATAGLSPVERQRFVKLAHQVGQHEQPVIEDSLELLSNMVEQGPGPLAGLDRQARVTALQLAIDAFPPGPNALLLDQMAWASLQEVDGVLHRCSPSNESVSLNGLSAPLDYTPNQTPPDLVSGYRDFLELQALVVTGRAGGPGGGPQVDARNALKIEVNHFHGHSTPFRTLLGLTGSPSLAAWGTHRLEEEASPEEREAALGRLASLRPGIENNELFHLIPLAARAENGVWQRIAQAPDYDQAIRRMAAIENLGGTLDPLWDQFAGLETRLSELGLKPDQVNRFVDWTVDHYSQLQAQLPEGADLPGVVGDVLAEPGPARHDRQFLDQVLAEKGAHESFEDCGKRLADDLWLHGDFASRDQHQKRLQDAFQSGQLSLENLAEAERECAYRMRLERVVGSLPQQAFEAALAALSGRPRSLLELEVTPEALTIGGISVEIAD
ncbi:MAG: hypothetical protein AB7S38_24770 [Vulcanimicrobiota bacterium]